MDIPRMKLISTPFSLPCRSRKSSVARRKWETFAIVKAPQSKRGKVCWGGGGRGRTAAEHDRRRPTANRNFQLPSLSARAEEPQSRDPTLPFVGFWRRGGGGGGGGRKSQPPGKGGENTAATRARRTAEEAGANSKRRGGRSEGGEFAISPITRSVTEQKELSCLTIALPSSPIGGRVVSCNC